MTRSPDAGALLLDLGTTHLKGVRTGPDGSVEGCAVRRAPSPLPTVDTRSEYDAVAYAAAAHEVVEELVDAAAGPLESLSISSQMHSVVLVDHSGSPVLPMISWQDDRLTELTNDRLLLDEVLDRVDESRRRRAGIARRPGYGAANLAAALRERPEARTSGARIHTVGSYFVETLGGPYATHVSSAAALGLVDVSAGEWLTELATDYGLEGLQLPRLARTYEPTGSVLVSGRELETLPDVGDHQASVVGSGSLDRNTVAISLGTAGLVARWSPEPAFVPGVDVRPYPLGGYLLTISRLPGGRLAAGVSNGLAALSDDVVGGRSLLQLLDNPEGLEGLNDPGKVRMRLDPGFAAAGVNLHLSLDAPASAGHVLRALADLYVEQYRGAIDTLFTDCVPQRLALNGGLAMKSSWMRNELARGLGLELVDAPTEDLALAGLIRLNRMRRRTSPAANNGGSE